jgi:hypothetical protein
VTVNSRIASDLFPEQVTPSAVTVALEREEALRMTAEHVPGDEPLIVMPALILDALRQAVAAVVPSQLPEFLQEIQDAFSQAGDEDSVYPIRHFYQRWAATIAIERRPSVAARLHAAERALADPDAVREQAIRKRPRSSRRLTTRSRVAEWRRECVTEDLASREAPRPCAISSTPSASAIAVGHDDHLRLSCGCRKAGATLANAASRRCGSAPRLALGWKA